LSHAAEHRECQASQSGTDPSTSSGRIRQAPSTMLTNHSSFHSYTSTANSSGGTSALTSISVLALTNTELSNSYELNDPLLEHFKSRVERRNHTMELVFSLDDAKRIFTVFADHTTNHITAKPVLVLVDEPDEFKRKETLTTLRELDPTRQELLLVVLRRDVLPNSVTFSEEEKRLHEQGADVLFTAGRSDSSIDLLLRSAETMQRCVAYATQTRVFAHALHQVNVSVDVLNTLGMLMWVNPAFEELTGYRFDEIQNCPLTFMEDTDGENKMGPAVNEVASLGTPWSGIMTLVTKTGKKVPHMCNITMVMTGESNPTPHLVCTRKPLGKSLRPSLDAMFPEIEANSTNSANTANATNLTTRDGGSVNMNVSD